MAFKNIDSQINDLVQKDDELTYKVADMLKKDINSFEPELESLSQVDGVDIEEIKQREPMRLAKALVESGIVDSRMFDFVNKGDK